MCALADRGQLCFRLPCSEILAPASPGHIWPGIEVVQGALNMIAKEDHHTLVIMEGEVPVLLVSLFGDIGAVIPLGEAPAGRLPRFSEKRSVWRIALPSRVLTKLNILEMIEDRLAPLRNAEGLAF